MLVWKAQCTLRSLLPASGKAAMVTCRLIYCPTVRFWFMIGVPVIRIYCVVLTTLQKIAEENAAMGVEVCCPGSPRRGYGLQCLI